MKGKLILSITIGFTAFIFTIIVFTQFKTIEKTDVTAIETMREAELRTELAKIKEKYEDVETKLEDTNNKINEYETEIANEQDSSNLLDQELNESKLYLGYTAVEGEGISITLTNNGNEAIVSYDLISLVNELKLAGAEAISINDNRVVSTTEIVDINDKFILVNGNRISSPIKVTAIGDQKYLESGITFKNGYLDEMQASGKDISYSLEDKIEMSAYDGEINFEYSSNVE